MTGRAPANWLHTGHARSAAFMASLLRLSACQTMPREPNRARLGRAFKGLNFGLLSVDWAARRGPMVSLQVRDQDNRPQLRVRFPLSRLKVAD